MSLPTEAIDATKAIRFNTSGRTEDSQEPGTLSKWQDKDNNESWSFTGNGQVTSTQFVQAVIDREAEGGNKDCVPVANNTDFARLAAASLLNEPNPDQPIPEGAVKEMSLKSLVGLIAPFMENYARQVAASQQGDGSIGGSDNEHKRLTGSVYSQGLTLPID